MKIDVVICGVGGQGVLLASEVLGALALVKGFDVKKSEIHGMAQRGGSVFSHVRIGDRVFSPVIPLASAGYMLAFEELEALRYAHFLREGASVLINRQRVSPMTVLSGEATYPENPVSMMEGHFRVKPLNALSLAREAGNVRAVNMVMLGALSVELPFCEDEWFEAMASVIPERFFEVNKRAFLLGREALSHGGEDTGS